MLKSSLSRSILRNPNTVPLDEPLPGFEHVQYQDSKSVKLFDAKITVLDTGLTVVTEPGIGEYCTLGLAIDAGPRYEAHYPLGVSHVIKKLAYNSTENFPDRQVTDQLLQEKGALVDCDCTKDTFMYASSCRVESAADLTKLIADAAQRPLFNEQELSMAPKVIKFENEAELRKPEPEPLFIDWVHEAAFSGNTLGFSKYCATQEAEKIRDSHLLSYMSQYFTPERMVLGAVGVEHELMVDLARQYLSPARTTWASSPDRVLPDLPPVDRSVAQYTGGDFRIQRDLSEIALGPTKFPNLAHIMIGFQGVSTTDPDFVPFCVLQSLFGGGGSFSSGGPGKGLFARLYTEVMNKAHWFYNATAFNFSYADAGLFAIRGSAPPKDINVALILLVNEFLRLAQTDVHPNELARAKTQLKSQLLMNLELRPVMFEDMARQVLTHKRRKLPDEYIDEIDRVQPADMRRIAERMLLSKPALVGYGRLEKLAPYEKLDQAVAQRSASILK